jgi:hypothetical protein
VKRSRRLDRNSLWYPPGALKAAKSNQSIDFGMSANIPSPTKGPAAIVDSYMERVKAPEFL